MIFFGLRRLTRRGLRLLFAPFLIPLLMPAGPALGHESQLDYIYDSCLRSFETALSRPGPHIWFTPRYPPPTRVKLRNPNRHSVSVCVYDNVCHRLIRTMRLVGRGETSVKICAEDGILGRGSILVVYRDGYVVRYDNLRGDRVTLPADR